MLFAAIMIGLARRRGARRRKPEGERGRETNDLFILGSSDDASGSNAPSYDRVLNRLGRDRMNRQDTFAEEHRATLSGYEGGSRDKPPPQAQPGGVPRMQQQLQHETSEQRRERQRANPRSELHRRLLKHADSVGGLFEHGKEGPSSKYTIVTLVFGQPVEAARGIYHYMCVDEDFINVQKARGLAALEEEVNAHGNETDIECLHYVLHEEAGSSPKGFQGGRKRDCGPDGNVLKERLVTDNGVTRPMVLADFVKLAQKEAPSIKEQHVAALRFYTTAAYMSINDPLRDLERKEAGQPHKLPITVAFIQHALKLLREVESRSPQKNKQVDLYRGMRNVSVPEEFAHDGGTELALMSTTANLRTAVEYAASTRSVLLRLRTRNFMTRGPGVAFLSAFPGEQEYLYPPLTYLQPVHDPVTHEPIVEELEVDDAIFSVIDVEPHMS